MLVIGEHRRRRVSKWLRRARHGAYRHHATAPTRRTHALLTAVLEAVACLRPLSMDVRRASAIDRPSGGTTRQKPSPAGIRTRACEDEERKRHRRRGEGPLEPIKAVRIQRRHQAHKKPSVPGAQRSRRSRDEHILRLSLSSEGKTTAASSVSPRWTAEDANSHPSQSNCA